MTNIYIKTADACERLAERLWLLSSWILERWLKHRGWSIELLSDINDFTGVEYNKQMYVDPRGEDDTSDLQKAVNAELHWKGEQREYS